MIKIFKYIFLVILLPAGFAATAQTTSSSPYSKFGLGNIKGPILPQNRAMGGISTGIRRIGAYNNVNLQNPGSYSDIRMTTIDVGAFGGITSLSNNTTKQGGVFNAALSHIVFGIPVSKNSALSFGLVPYSDLGYNYTIPGKIDTNNVNYKYSGEGGLSQGYIGYGFSLGKHFSVGANASYIFGKLEESATTDFDVSTTFTNSRTSRSRAIGGLSLEYGAQYFTNPKPATRLIIGYSGTSGNKINSTATNLTTHFAKVFNQDTGDQDELTASDTTFFSEGAKSKLRLPSKNSLGFTLESANKWLIGADVTATNWSSYRDGATNPGLNNSFTVNVGGQLTPDFTSVTNYLKLIDYRFGFKYDKTYINIKNTDIRDAAVTFGLGLPLPSNRGVSFYKINFATELGQRGTLQNGLVRERYANFYIGITLNDQWFQKFKFD
ncbi:hypothetical protein [Hufsiella ginkgonis]|uniref:Outer membrane beta-barrel protein n=1 Tax=Hufsiella ginkgonis TaxID=2695274 RepID=A0A7K1XTZ1_9SPHI|nr:hypothetical protein [Hufsiella ginkgonis]MXV14442.1 hypothetical protein [Hufsiella ginkgonis]